MTYPPHNREFITGRWLAIMMLGCLGLLSACTSDGTTTILENEQTIVVGLPDELIDAIDDETLEASNVSPLITLSNGAGVTTTLVDVNNFSWSGTINVDTGAVYTVTILWVERYLDQDLPLTRRTLDLAVGADGSTVEVEGSRTDYSQEGLDFDSDGIMNLAERLSGTDPLVGVEPPPDTGEQEPPTSGTNAGVPIEVSTSLPDVLLDDVGSGVLSRDDLSPVVTVERGNTVDAIEMTATAPGSDEWTGIFNLTNEEGVVKVTVIWVEDFEGAPLDLARQTIDYFVGGDGRPGRTATGFDINLNADEDEPSNLQERRDGTDPRTDGS